MHVTYLLGAGASANAIPTVVGLSQGLRQFAAELEKFGTPEGLNSSVFEINKSTSKNLITNLDWLAGSSEKFGSVDTFAKILYLRNDQEDLHVLKSTLTAYLNYRQSKVEIDRRYFSFWASILRVKEKNKLEVPNTLAILTWNYDQQLELSISELQVDYSPFLAYKYQPRSINNNPMIFKLNGTAFTHKHDGKNRYLLNVKSLFDQKNFTSLVGNYNRLLKGEFGERTGISFAWEEGEMISDVIDLIARTDILVVVGYSFPFFNRTVDERMLKGMMALQKIYIQDETPEAIKSRISGYFADGTVEFSLHPKDDRQFYLPDELE
jgi:hypothetical protein